MKKEIGYIDNPYNLIVLDNRNSANVLPVHYFKNRKDMCFTRNGYYIRGHYITHHDISAFSADGIKKTGCVDVAHLSPDMGMFWLKKEKNVVHGENTDELAVVVNNHHAEDPAIVLQACFFKLSGRYRNRGLGMQRMERCVHDMAGCYHQFSSG
jgi:hypothetical protein